MNKIITVKKRTTASGYESLNIYVNGKYLGNVFADSESVQVSTHTLEGRVAQFQVQDTKTGGKMFSSLFYSRKD